jgi:hypothetical protein
MYITDKLALKKKKLLYIHTLHRRVGSMSQSFYRDGSKVNFSIFLTVYAWQTEQEGRKDG